MAITLKELQSVLPIEDVLMGGVQYGIPQGSPRNITSPTVFSNSQTGNIPGINTQSGTYIPGITPQPNQGGNSFDNSGINSIGSTSGLFGLQTNDFINAKNLGLMALGFNPVGLAFGTIASAGIGSLIDNYQNPYTNIFGNLNQQTQDAIARDQARDMQESNRAGRTGGYQAGYSSDFMEGPPGGTGGSPGSSGPGGSDSMGST
tara:strand:- start:64 stop:675 length:612 start_codon:yes stop_codon:yes gene_type:complete